MMRPGRARGANTAERVPITSPRLDERLKMLHGEDPQLDAAIELMLAELEQNPPRRPERPPYPDRSGMGIEEEDK